MKRLLFAVALQTLACPLFAKIELGTPFSDHVVLQRDCKVPVWGNATPGNEIAVEFNGQKQMAVVNSLGKWRICLSPMPMSDSGLTLRVWESKPGLSGRVVDSVEVKDALVGEVWFASGQSNMECPIWGPKPRYRDGNGALVVAMTRLPKVRYCKNSVKWSVEPLKLKSVWRTLTPENVTTARFSAVAYYYARELYLALGVPIGIVDSSWGGTSIDAWTPRCGYSDCDPAIASTAQYVAKKDWNPEKDASGPIAQPRQQPSVIWNGMVDAWTPMAIRGVIWYQGCSNACDGDRYCAKMHALYNGWSRAFENSSLKLYFVQLAPFSQNWIETVEAQNKFVREQPNAAIAVTADIGNFDDIHPNRKETVAKRLAVHALKRDYGMCIGEDDSPVFAKAHFDGARVELSFDHVNAWYVYSPDRSVDAAFELAGADGVWHPAKIVNLKTHYDDRRGNVVQDYLLEGKTILLTSEKVPEPCQVNYMCRRRTAGTLYNEMSLPLGPFRAVK